MIARVDLSGKDTYALALDPGQYQLALVDEAGCAYCDHHSRLVENEVTRHNVLLDWAGE